MRRKAAWNACCRSPERIQRGIFTGSVAMATDTLGAGVLRNVEVRNLLVQKHIRVRMYPDQKNWSQVLGYRSLDVMGAFTVT